MNYIDTMKVRTCILFLLCLYAVAPQMLLGQQEEVSQLFRQSEAKKTAQYAFAMYDMSGQQDVVRYHVDAPMIPASVTKLFTTSLALHTLPNYPYVTEFSITGPIKNGILQGDLVIKGSGDPTIYSKYFPEDSIRFKDALLTALMTRGVVAIEGAVRVDASAYDKEAFNPLWDLSDRGEWYANGVYGFNIFDNWIDIFLQTGKTPRSVKILKTYPRDTGVEFVNMLTTAKHYGSAEGDGLPLVNKRILKGKLPAQRRQCLLSVDLPNPPQFAARYIAQLLERAGIHVARGTDYSFEPVAPNKNNLLIGQYFSPSVVDICRACNVHSINHYAEALLRRSTVGESMEYSHISTRQALRSAKDFFCQKGLHFSSSSAWVDGSGLSRKNRFTVQDLMQLLQFMNNGNKAIASSFIASLPKVGYEGSVKHLFRGEPFTAYFKSGTMRGIKAYAGYLTYKEKQYAVVFMANDIRSTAKVIQVFRQALHLSLGIVE